MMAAPTIQAILAAAAAPADCRISRYMARVDAHLPTLADDAERLRFLKYERCKWTERYRNWAQRIDSGTADAQDLSQSAFDYTGTLVALSGKIVAMEKVAA